MAPVCHGCREAQYWRSYIHERQLTFGFLELPVRPMIVEPEPLATCPRDVSAWPACRLR